MIQHSLSRLPIINTVGSASRTSTRYSQPEPSLPVRHTEEAVPPVYAREDLLAARFRVARVLPFQQTSPFISNLSLAIFSGLLLVFAFPDWNLWSLGWVGTAPLIMAIVRERRFWRSMLLGTVTGTIFYAGSSYWVTYSMHNYGDLSLLACYVILIIFSATLGVFTGLFGAALGLAIKRLGAWAILAAPVLWAASEWLRLKLTGMGWNPLGYSQAFQPSVIQVARFGGVYIVSAIMVAASAALVFALVYLERRRGIVVLTAAGAIAIATVLYGESLRPTASDTGSVLAAAIQPNIPIEGAWDDPSFTEQMFQRHVTLSEQAVQANKDSSPGVDLIIWPESGMNYEYDRDTTLRQRLAEFVRRNQIYLLMNTWGFHPDSVGAHIEYNSAVLIAPSGEKIAQYDKNALVPFGEYIPARNWIPFMANVKALVGDITPGTSLTTSEVDGAKIGTIICFETTRPELARELRTKGATVLIQLSNEAWFGPTSAPRQMLASAIFRAVENNIQVIRAANSGVSACIDGYGLVRGETPMFDTATRIWKIKTDTESANELPTFYSRHGDVFVISCLVLSCLLVLSSVFKVPSSRFKV